VDALFKYKGFAFAAEYADRSTPSPIISVPLKRFVYKGNGYAIQASYLFKSNYEIAARYTTARPHTSIAALTPQVEDYTLAASKYLRRHRFKLQSDLTYQKNTWLISTVATDNILLRFQVEFGF
jgi:phosphate-selective porin OprO and OprP